VLTISGRPDRAIRRRGLRGYAAGMTGADMTKRAAEAYLHGFPMVFNEDKMVLRAR
jgi:hypothetical protein